MDIVLHSLMIHPALGIQFLVVVGITIELRPHTDHETTSHLMNRVEHQLRIGET